MDPQTDVSAVSETVGVEPPVSNFGGAIDVNGHDTSLDSSFLTYPSAHPFVDTDYQASPVRPIMSFPQFHRDGVLSALEILQEKMKKLEVERREAENNLKTLASDTQLYKSSLRDTHFHFHSHPSSPPAQSQEEEEQAEEEEEEEEEEDAGISLANTRPQQKQLESQLSSAETRCQVLEKQLEYMRKMVHRSERERTQAVQKAEVLQQQHKVHDTPSSVSSEYHTQLERIGELERDHLRLTATQTLAESKIKELEARLKQERDHQKMLKHRPLNGEKSPVPQQVMLHLAENPPSPPLSSQRKKKSGSNKKKKQKVATRKAVPVRSEPSKHYRLNLADIPFVAGKSTAPSHAVGANVQKVLAMMKSHNLALCSPLFNGHSHGHGGCNGENVEGLRSPAPHFSSTLPVDHDLADLLVQLQDEFGQLSLEHQEYLQALQEATDPCIRQDLERELDTLMVRMEVKGQQISKVRQHQQRLEDATKAAKRGSKKSEPLPRPSSAFGRLQTSHKHPHPHSQASGNLRPKSSTRHECDQRYNELVPPSLSVLRNMRKLQTTLRRDDLCWE